MKSIVVPESNGFGLAGRKLRTPGSPNEGAPVDPELGLDVATESRDLDLRLALSNSFAFGGSNVSLVFGAPQ